jgi:hypothetical protein
MTQTPVDFKPSFGAFVIETLTLGMYGEARNALREYVQNAFDSLREAVDAQLVTPNDAKVEVTLGADKNSLTIRDNGLGLSINNAVDTLAAIGSSSKNYRKNAGFRGIGRLAGIVFCNKLTFTTKAGGENERTVVTFKAKELREKLAPDGQYLEDAAETLRSTVEAYREDAPELAEHFFEVKLEGFEAPPVECQDKSLLKSFLSQVCPIPYSKDFELGSEITEKGRTAKIEVETVRLFVREGDEEFHELFKPYGKDFAVKSKRVEIVTEFVESPSNRWWGWVGRPKLSGTIKDQDSRGIRVRVRNIQIDDTKIIRDIFAVSRLADTKARSSYARFADWYVGEIFLDPKAAIPNARRDGFEENKAWDEIRDELDVRVATPYGKLAYRTSNRDQLSVENLQRRFDTLKVGAEPLIEARASDWDRISVVVSQATELQRRIGQSVKSADDAELTALTALSQKTAGVKVALSALAAPTAPLHDCTAEVAEAVSAVVQKIYTNLKRNLSPAEWKKAQAIVHRATEEPFK